MAKNPSWQHASTARRKLWYLVMERFSAPAGRYSITLTRDDLLTAGVIGPDFDAKGRPKVPVPFEQKKPYPVWVCSVCGEEFVLTHPEHAHHQLPAGRYQVTYQADMVSMRAVAD